ncbi:MAG: hypothetical protein ABMA13_17750 [Chthoniobacteraceae bacterium]
MNNNRPLLVLAAVVLAIAGGTLWFLNSTKVPDLNTGTAPADIHVPVGPQVNLPPSIAPGTPKKIETANAPMPPKPAGTPRPLAEWELRIDEVLRSAADESQTAQILINMLPTLPPEGQEEAAQHISNLVLDENYSKVLPLVKNPNLPEEVLDVFVTDLMNRDDSTKLPALLEIAKIPNHPHHEEALTDLEIFLDEDFGNDFGRWDSAVKTYLKKQAAEEAEANAAVPPPPLPGATQK